MLRLSDGTKFHCLEAQQELEKRATAKVLTGNSVLNAIKVIPARHTLSEVTRKKPNSQFKHVTRQFMLEEDWRKMQLNEPERQNSERHNFWQQEKHADIWTED